MLSDAEQISSEAAAAQAAIDPYNWRGLPTSDAVATLSEAAQNYQDLTQSIMNDIRSGTTDMVAADDVMLDPATIAVPSLDSEIKRLEATFGAC